MIKTLTSKLITSLLLVIPVGLFAQSTEKSSLHTQPTIFLIGAIHNMHFNQGGLYSINDLLFQVQELKPDVVCGEISPEAYNNTMEGYFPPEAAFLAEMSTQLGYRFVPADWRIDYSTQDLASKHVPEHTKKRRSELLSTVQAEIKSREGESLYDVLHDDTILNYLDSLYERIVGVDPLAEISAGSWNERNRRIVENGLRASAQAKTVVFVFGIDHIPQIKRHLEKLGYKVVIPQRMFSPNKNNKVTANVINRWQRNLNNLKAISDKKIDATYDDYLKVTNSNRIKDLEEAIQKAQN
ncbi:hypothetical protein DSECCO2_292460 [anaerobic digester metagenome]